MQVQDTYRIMKLCEVRLQQDPDDPDALFTRAAVLARLGEYHEALERLNRVEACDDRYPGLTNFRDRLLLEIARSRTVHVGHWRGDNVD